MKPGELLDKAILIATNAHHGQLDKGGKPYILHPLAVMHMLDTTDEEVLCIAILHDVVEDTDVTFRQLLDAGLTQRIVDGVRALTKMPGESYDEYKERVFANIDAMQVKACDLRHNSDLTRLKGIRDKDVERMIKYQKFYYEIQVRLSGA